MRAVLSFVFVLVVGVVGLWLSTGIDMPEIGIVLAVAAAGACVVGVLESKK